MERDEWIRRFAEALGSNAPSAGEIEAILDLAAVAAHSSVRQAAPVACWVAGRSGRSLSELNQIAQSIAPPADV